MGRDRLVRLAGMGGLPEGEPVGKDVRDNRMDLEQADGPGIPRGDDPAALYLARLGALPGSTAWPSIRSPVDLDRPTERDEA